MIIILKPQAEKRKVDALVRSLEADYGLEVQRMDGVNYSILGLIGDTSALDMEPIQEHEAVKKVMRVQEPYKKVNRAFHPDDTVITGDGFTIGGKHLAGWQGVQRESEEQIILWARAVKGGRCHFPAGRALSRVPGHTASRAWP